MFAVRVRSGWVYPVAVWMVMLALIFCVEYSVMLLLPWLVPQPASRLFESVVDACVLTVILAPVLWWTLVRPLREVIRLREQFLVDLFAQIETDRRQTASELHDGVGQALTLLISGLRSAKSCRVVEECAGRVDGFRHLAENALTEVRRLCLGLRPSLLDDLGLAPALEHLVEDVRTNHPVAITLDVSKIDIKQVSDRVGTAVFRIVQEALANIIKHSQARHVRVNVRTQDRSMFVEITDDGTGVEPARFRQLPSGHLGVRGMRERAALLGGVFRIDSTPGHGTQIHVSLPMGDARG